MVITGQSCDAAGDNGQITDPYGMIELSTYGELQCYRVIFFARNGFLTTDECTEAKEVAFDPCGCENSETSSAETVPTENSPVDSPPSDDAAVDNPPTEAPTSSAARHSTIPSFVPSMSTATAVLCLPTVIAVATWFTTH
jgi:hypothetical protein